MRNHEYLTIQLFYISNSLSIKFKNVLFFWILNKIYHSIWLSKCTVLKSRCDWNKHCVLVKESEWSFEYSSVTRNNVGIDTNRSPMKHDTPDWNLVFKREKTRGVKAPWKKLEKEGNEIERDRRERERERESIILREFPSCNLWMKIKWLTIYWR